MQTPHVVTQRMQPFAENIQVARRRLVAYGARCHDNSCDSWPSESNGEEKRNKRTFTKAPANVKSLLTLLTCSSQVLTIKKKKGIMIQARHTNISTVVCDSPADCCCVPRVCPVSREDSSQSLTSCLNLLPSPMDPTGDRIPGKDSSQRYSRGERMNTLLSCDSVYSRG